MSFSDVAIGVAALAPLGSKRCSPQRPVARLSGANSFADKPERTHRARRYARPGDQGLADVSVVEARQALSGRQARPDHLVGWGRRKCVPLDGARSQVSRRRARRFIVLRDLFCVHQVARDQRDHDGITDDVGSRRSNLCFAAYNDVDPIGR